MARQRTGARKDGVSARVLHLVRSLRPETGGIAEAVRQLVAAQGRRGDEAMIVSLDPADEPSRDGVVVLGRRSHGYGYAAELVPWLQAQRNTFDAVIVHGLWQYQSLGAWRALHDGPIPYLVYPHGMLDVWFKRAHPLKHAKKWLYWPWADFRVLRDAAAVCFTAENERRRARESFWLYRAREKIVPVGIVAPPADADRQRAAFFAAHPGLREQPFLLFLGRVHPKKGVDLLLQAYARTWRDAGRGPIVAIAGPGEPGYRAQLQRTAREIGLGERVQWLPMLSGDVKWGAFRACEAFALFSHQENFGVAVVEAMACGRPVLISDAVAIAGEIAADGAGIVDSDTTDGAARALACWRDLGTERRERMGHAAAAAFMRRYEIGRAAEGLARVIDEVRNSR